MQYLATSMTPSAIIDIVALALVVIFALIGLSKGFAKTFVKVFGVILSLLFAVMLASSVATYLEKSFSLITKASGWLNNLLTRIIGDGVMNTTIGDATEEALKNANVAGWLIGIILSFSGNVDTTVTLNEIICPVFGYYLVLTLSVIILFIIFRIIFFLIGEIISKMHKIKIVGATDKILGFIFGIVRALILIYFVVLIINVVPIGFIQKLAVHIENTTITKYIYKINLFGVILKGFSSVKVGDVVKNLIASKV